jgi:hypothetical protein
MRRPCLWLGAGLLVVAGLLRATPAWACTPPPGGLPSYTATDRTLAAPIVLEGTAIAVSGEVYGQTAVVEVSRYLKGIGPQLIAISGYGSSSICLSEISQNFTGVFYVSGDEATGYSAFYLSQFDALASNDEATVTEVIAASGQEPRTDFAPYHVGTPDAILTLVLPTRIAALPTPTPAPFISPPPFSVTPSPYLPTPPVPTSSSTYVFTSLYSLGLLALGGAIGLIVGLVLGLLIGRRR